MRDAEALGLGSAFISERFNIKEAATLSGAAAAVSAAHRHRHRGDEPQHPPPAHHRVVRHDHAPAHGRPLHARARPRHRRDLRRVRAAEDHHRADGGHRRAAAPPVARRGGHRPRRSRREVRHPAPRRVVRRGHPARPGRVRAEHARARRAAPSTWSCCTRSSPTRPPPAPCDTVRKAAEAAGRDPAAVRVWSCYATIPDTIPEDLRLKKTVGRLATYLQGYGDLLVRTNGWDPDVLARFRADEVVAVGAGRDRPAWPTRRPSSTSATLLPDEWLEPAAYGTPDAVRPAGAAPVRPRRRRRDHARRDARRARGRGRRVPRPAPRRPVRRAAGEPGCAVTRGKLGPADRRGVVTCARR